MATFKIVCNGKIAGIEHAFRGGNGVPEVYIAKTLEEDAILRGWVMASQVEDVEEVPEREPAPAKVRHVGKIPTHGPDGVPAGPEEVEDEEETEGEVGGDAEEEDSEADQTYTSAVEKKRLEIIGRLRAAGKTRDGFDKHVRPLAKRYGINCVGVKHEKLYADIGERYMAEVTVEE